MTGTSCTLLNETLFTSLTHARAMIAAWTDDYNTERPPSSLGEATPAAFAAALEKQQAGLDLPVASPERMRNQTRRSLVPVG